jgi:hypothetical protein
MNLQLLFITEEAWFYLGGHFNKKKYIWMWNDENSHAIQWVPLQSIKLGV